MKECFTAQEIEAWKPRKIANNTWRYVRPDVTSGDLEIEAIRLHHTDIIKKDRKGRVTLFSGGYRTRTTKDRINRFSPYRVYSVKGVWYVWQGIVGKDTLKVPFYDGIVLPDAFKTKPGSSFRVENKLREQVKRMLAKLDKSPVLPQPSHGDCFFCQAQAGGTQVTAKVMRWEGPGVAPSVTGIQGSNPEIDPHGCVKEHLKEGYLHGSLLVRAMLARGYGNPAVVWHMRTHGWSEFSEGKRTGKNYYKGDMKRELKRFLCQAVGI
jgi:hypothetical protein